MSNFKINDAFEMDEISLRTPKISYNLALPDNSPAKDMENIKKISNKYNKFFISKKKKNFFYSSTKLTCSDIIIISILFAVNLLNYMDRYTVAAVLTDIQIYFNLNDSNAGMLQTAFIVFFMLFAPLCGFLGDRYNRKGIMIIGLSVWITAVMASSFVSKEVFF